VTPYRQADLPAKTGEPARQLVYAPLTKISHRLTAARTHVRYFIFAPIIAVILYQVHWVLTVVFLVAMLAWDIPKWLRDKGIRVRLYVDDGKLVIDPKGSLGREIAIARIADVRLDTRTVNQAHHEVRPDGLLASGPAFTTDESRIILVVDDAGPIRLTEDYFPHSDSLEWLGRIRVFLKRLGWVPEDERSPS
jgi:hypothetical protein